MVPIALVASLGNLKPFLVHIDFGTTGGSPFRSTLSGQEQQSVQRAEWVAQSKCGPPNIPDLFVREGPSSFLSRLKVASFQTVDRVVSNDFPVDDPVEEPRQMLADLPCAAAKSRPHDCRSRHLQERDIEARQGRKALRSAQGPRRLLPLRAAQACSIPVSGDHEAGRRRGRRRNR